MNQLIDSRELIPVLAWTIALDQKIEDASFDLVLELNRKTMTSGWDCHHAHDALLIDLSDYAARRNACVDEYEFLELDDEIRILEHMLSDLHGISLVSFVGIPDFDPLEETPWF
jgi:hypothetical protein